MSAHFKKIYTTYARQRRARRYSVAAALLLFLAILAFGSVPGKAQTLSDAFGDKALHLAAYGTLSVMLYFGLYGSAFKRSVKVVACIALLGLLDETVQSFLPYRSASWADFQFDLLAAVAGVAGCAVVQTAVEARDRARSQKAIGAGAGIRAR